MWDNSGAGGWPVSASAGPETEIMSDKKTKSAANERAALSSEFSQDISYSMWRRGAGYRSGEPIRQPGALLR